MIGKSGCRCDNQATECRCDNQESGCRCGWVRGEWLQVRLARRGRGHTGKWDRKKKLNISLLCRLFQTILRTAIPFLQKDEINSVNSEGCRAVRLKHSVKWQQQDSSPLLSVYYSVGLASPKTESRPGENGATELWANLQSYAASTPFTTPKSTSLPTICRAHDPAIACAWNCPEPTTTRFLKKKELTDTQHMFVLLEERPGGRFDSSRISSPFSSPSWSLQSLPLSLFSVPSPFFFSITVESFYSRRLGTRPQKHTHTHRGREWERGGAFTLLTAFMPRSAQNRCKPKGLAQPKK